MNIAESLALHIADHEREGAYHASSALGCVSMPPGYALMLNGDQTHYYWLRHDGVEGPIDWNRWAVRRRAIANAEMA